MHLLTCTSHADMFDRISNLDTHIRGCSDTPFYVAEHLSFEKTSAFVLLHMHPVVISSSVVH
jgi:hypothetical protein